MPSKGGTSIAPSTQLHPISDGDPQRPLRAGSFGAPGRSRPEEMRSINYARSDGANVSSVLQHEYNISMIRPSADIFNFDCIDWCGAWEERLMTGGRGGEGGITRSTSDQKARTYHVGKRFKLCASHWRRAEAFWFLTIANENQCSTSKHQKLQFRMTIIPFKSIFLQASKTISDKLKEAHDCSA